MQKFLLFIVVGFVALLHVAEAQTNYCAAGLCPAGVQHIACQHSGRFDSTCPANAVMVDLTKLRTSIVKMHNVRRNTLANGKLPGYQPAARMATMQWNNELATIAAYNVKQCIMKHDKCRNTPKFSKSGQNLGYISYTGDRNAFTNQEIIAKLIKLWWGEYKYANMAVMQSYPADWSGKDIGHFTVMAADKNTRVGCAASRYTRGSTHNFLLACNYATTNILNESIYRTGGAATACKKGKNANFRGLCATTEVYSGL